MRLGEEEIVGEERQDAGVERGPEAEPGRGDEDADEEDQRQAGDGKEVVDQHREARRQRDDPGRCQIVDEVAVGRDRRRPDDCLTRRVTVGRDQRHLEISRGPKQFLRHALTEKPRQEAPRPLAAEHDPADVARAREGKDLVRDMPLRVERHDLGPERFGEALGVGDGVLGGVGKRLGEGRDHAHRDPRRMRPLGHPLRGPDQRLGHRRFVDADEDAVLRRPWAADRVRPHVGGHLGIDPIGRDAHRKLAQRREVALREEVLHRPADLLGHVDLALACSRSISSSAGRSISSISSASCEHAVGHRLADADAGDPGDDVVEALEVLDVERREDVDAARRAPRRCRASAWDAGCPGGSNGPARRSAAMRRPPREHGVEVELGERPAAILDLLPRQDLEVGQSAAVSARPCVSTMPTTTSTPPALRRRACSSMA